jgi:hypothetical protein
VGFWVPSKLVEVDLAAAVKNITAAGFELLVWIAARQCYSVARGKEHRVIPWGQPTSLYELVQ